MADTPPAKPEAGKGTFGFLTRKIGPVPIWVIGVAAFGGYYWYTHYGPGAQKQAATAATTPKQQRPQIIVVTGKGGKGGGKAGPAGPAGPGGPAGPPAPPDKDGRPRPRKRPLRPGRNPPPRLPPSPAPPLAQPVTAAAPMTAGDIYGSLPTASPDGSTYDSGYPTAAQLEGAYVPAG